MSRTGVDIGFTERFRCPDHPDIVFPVPSPQLFSFNNPYGSCPECTGFGAVLQYDPTLIVPNPARSLDEGAVDPWSKPRYDKRRRLLADFAGKNGVRCRNAVAGHARSRSARRSFAGRRASKGVLPFLRALEEKRYKQYIRVFLRQYQSALDCPTCGGDEAPPGGTSGESRQESR